MGSAERELEDQLVELGNRLASPPSNVDELLALLDLAESSLSRVEQAPSESMAHALYPAMKALVAKELLNHSELDVKISVASCFSEITRITAPDAPYEDDLMMDIFQMIVDAFENLDDLSSRSYSKRVSILETVANVRSCVLMLDLECDDLILQMFQHFLQTIRTGHTRNVFSSMETIMTLVLKESEDISSELLSCLLASAKMDTMDPFPITRRLGEKVIGNCAVKLKPYLVKLVQSREISSNDYSNVVTSICQENSDASELNEVNASGDCLESGKLVADIGRPEENGTVADKSSKLVLSNAVGPTGNGDSVIGTISPKQKSEYYRGICHPRSAIATAIAEPDDLDSSIVVKSDRITDHSAKNRRSQKRNSTIQSRDTSGHSQIDGDQSLAVSSRRRGRSRETDGPSVIKARASLRLGSERRTERRPSIGFNSKNIFIGPPTPSENSLGAIRPKKVRSSASKVSARKNGGNTVADMAAAISGQKGASDNDQSEEETLPSDDIESKEYELVSNSVGKPLSSAGKRILKQDADDGETPSAGVLPNKVVETIDLEAKKMWRTSNRRSTRKVTMSESSEWQNFKIKHLNGKFSVEKDLSGEHNLQELVSSPESLKAPNKGQHLSDDSGRTRSKRKRARGTEEISEAPIREEELGEELVGSKIKVWWPEDKMFYEGVIDSFYPDLKKHKVLYFDGDVEVLLLKDECWKLLEGDSKTNGGQSKEIPSIDSPPEIALNRIATRSSDSMAKQGKIEKSWDKAMNKSRAYGIGSSGKKGGNDVRKTRVSGKRAALNLESTSGDEISEDLGGVKVKSVRKYKDEDSGTSTRNIEEPGDQSEDDCIVIGSKLKGDYSKWVSMSKGDSQNVDVRTKDIPSKTDSKSKDDRPESGYKSNEDASKMVGKSKDIAGNTGNKPKTGSIGTASKSDEGIAKAGWNLKGVNAQKTGGKSISDGTLAKGKPKLQGSDDYDAKRQLDLETSHENAMMTGRKRSRMGESRLQADLLSWGK